MSVQNRDYNLEVALRAGRGEEIAKLIATQDEVDAVTPGASQVVVGSPTGAQKISSVPNQFLMPDGTTWGMFVGSPVLMSNWSQDKIPTDGVTGVADKLSAFFARAASLDMGAVLLPGYSYNADKPIAGVSYLRLHAYGAKITFTDTGATTRCLVFDQKTDFTIAGLEIDGNKSAMPATEQKHNLHITGCQRFALRDLYLHDAKGDGYYIGSSAGVQSARLYAENVRSENNYRNNCSVISLTRGEFTRCDFNGAAGTSPESGIDIEPNSNADVVRYLTFTACDFSGNNGDGFQTSYKVGATEYGDVTIMGGSSHDNNGAGIRFYNARRFTLTNFGLTGNLYGAFASNGDNRDIVFYGGEIAFNKRDGVRAYPNIAGDGGMGSIQNWRMHGTDVHDNSQEVAGTYDGLFFGRDSSATGVVDTIVLTNMSSTGATQKRGLETTAIVSNVSLSDVDLRGNVSAATLNDDATTRTLRNVNGLSTTVNFTAAGTLNNYALIAQVNPTNTSSPFTLTLPAAPEYREYLIINTNGNTSGTSAVTIAANAGQTIRNVTLPLTISAAYGVVKLFYRANNWYVVARTP